MSGHSRSQVIDNKFRLQRYLGGTEEPAVSSRSSPDHRHKKPPSNSFPAGTTADLQLSLWRPCNATRSSQLLASSTSDAAASEQGPSLRRDGACR